MNEEIFLRELAHQIKIARNKAGVSQLTVQNKTGIHVGRIEQGKMSIQLYTLLRLCKYLDISPDEILRPIEKNL